MSIKDKLEDVIKDILRKYPHVKSLLKEDVTPSRMAEDIVKLLDNLTPQNLELLKKQFLERKPVTARVKEKLERLKV